MIEKVSVNGIRTCAFTDKQTNVECFLEKKVKNEIVIYLRNGVTGYESFYLRDVQQEVMFKNGWLACKGTPKKYDDLFISGHEMKAAFEKLGLLENSH